MNTSEVRAGERVTPSSGVFRIDPGSTRPETPKPPIDEGVGTFVMPSEEFLVTISDPDQPICVLGPGLKVKPQSYEAEAAETIAVVSKAGILTRKKPNTFYVDVLLNNVSNMF